MANVGHQGQATACHSNHDPHRQVPWVSRPAGGSPLSIRSVLRVFIKIDFGICQGVFSLLSLLTWQIILTAF